jgi:O-antigen/teichoic acid export membrane protein
MTQRLRFDLIANVLGQGWAVVVGLLFIPLFVHQLGGEGYGLIALLPVVSGLALVLDGGIAVTLNREMSRAIGTRVFEDARITAWTLLVAHALMGATVGIALLAALPAFGPAWLRPQDLANADLRLALLLLAAVVGAQWPISFFQNGLMGLGQQWRVNAALAAYATAANVGAAALVVFVSPSPAIYFGWLAVSAAVHAGVLAYMFWRSLPPSAQTTRFQPEKLRQLWRFSTGSFGISASGVILTYADRLVASRLLSLEQFGYYGLATTLGRSIYPLITPIFSAAFPRFSAFVARGDKANLTHLYALFAQIMSAALFPVAAVVFWMGTELMYAWLGDRDTAQAVAGPAALLVLGAALNGVMNIPYALQLSSGLVKLGLRINALLLIVVFPAAVGLYFGFGPAGIAATWLVVNGLYLTVGLPLIHRAAGIGPARRWLLFNTVPAAALSFALVGGVHALVKLGEAPETDRLQSAVLVILALIIAYASVWVATPALRREAAGALRRFRGAMS